MTARSPWIMKVVGAMRMGWGLAPGFVCFCVFFNLTGKK